MKLFSILLLSEPNTFKCLSLGLPVIKVVAITRDGNGKHLHSAYRISVKFVHIFKIKAHLCELKKLYSVLLLSVGL